MTPRGRKHPPSENRVRVIEALAALEEAGQTATMTELARLATVPRTTAYRVVLCYWPDTKAVRWQHAGPRGKKVAEVLRAFDAQPRGSDALSRLVGCRRSTAYNALYRWRRAQQRARSAEWRERMANRAAFVAAEEAAKAAAAAAVRETSADIHDMPTFRAAA